MKRLVVFLFGLGLLSGISAQQPDNDTLRSKTADSTMQIYQKENLTSREAILLEKLSSDQLLELEQQRLNNERELQKLNNEKERQDNSLPLPPFSIVLITLAPFIMVVLIVFFSVRAKNRKEQLRYDLYIKSLESGQPLPDKLFEKSKEQTPRLQRALVWLGVGIGLVLMAFIMDKKTLYAGIIPAFVGLGILTSYLIEKPKKDNTSADE